jgi:tetratricopeptide (TPR) repeat protein
VRLCQDRVQVSNNCAWLVRYYFEHNQLEKALKLAQDAAAVYSLTGLCTLAKLYDRMGKLTDAEHYYLQATERYGDNADLCQFYLRHKDNAAYKSKADSMHTKAFPRGLQKLQPEDLNGPPKAGARIKSESNLTKKYGLKIGDVFVGVDGYRVGSELQYVFVRNIETDGSNLEVVVWNGKEYRTIKAVLPSKKFGCEIEDYFTN